jgi:hypothetical protein
VKRWDIDAPSSSQYHRSPDGEWVEWVDVAELEERLAEATGLLGRCKLELPASSWTSGLLGDVTAFLSRAPAQPSVAWHIKGKSVELGPSADAQLAEYAASVMHDYSVAYQRAESAEAQLAAAQEELRHEREGHEVTEQARLLACREATKAEAQLAAVRWYLDSYRYGAGEGAVLAEIGAILTQPTPGAGTGEPAYRATCRTCDAPLNRQTGTALEPTDCPACGEERPR